MYTAGLESIPCNSAVGSVQLQLCYWPCRATEFKGEHTANTPVAMAEHCVNTCTQLDTASYSISYQPGLYNDSTSCTQSTASRQASHSTERISDDCATVITPCTRYSKPVATTEILALTHHSYLLATLAVTPQLSQLG